MTGHGSKLYLNSLRVRAWIKAFGWLAQLFETVAGAKFTFRRDVVPREGSFRRGGEAVEANIRKQKGSTLCFFCLSGKVGKEKGSARQVCCNQKRLSPFNLRLQRGETPETS